MIFSYHVNVLCIVLCGSICICSSEEIGSQNDTVDTSIETETSSLTSQGRLIHGDRTRRAYLNSPTQYPYFPNHHTGIASKYPLHVYATPYPHQPYSHSHQTNNHLHGPHHLQAAQQQINHPTGLHYPNRFSSFKPPSQSVMDVLYSVARNDDLHCVPKIICEIISDVTSGRQQSGSNSPIAINMQSLIGLLSGLDGLQSSPLFYFAKAALLGYTMRDNAQSCRVSFPDCPADPDRLVQYLNNHNGGFFRFFAGIHPSQDQQKIGDFYRSQQFKQKNSELKPIQAEERIQNKPTNFIPGTGAGEQYGIVFPMNDLQGLRSPKELIFPPSKDYFFLYKTANPFKFPEDDEENTNNQPFRKQKDLPYGLSFYQSSDLDFQKPLPNHRANPMIFPDRTGTGEFKLDFEDLYNRY